MNDHEVMNDAEARQALKADLARFNARVAQPDDPPLFTREPKPVEKSVHWKWRDLEPLLDRIGKTVDLDAKGPRRTLRLQNPGLPYGTTNTFWASIQVILPGEVASAHRHSASAFRFIMKGTGATTTVEGERYPMNEGDLVLTPAWTWHDHVHHGREPMIWLDVLDINLMKMMQATFFEGHDVAEQDVSAIPDRSWREYGSGLMSPPGHPLPVDAPNPLLAYGRDMSREALSRSSALQGDPVDDNVLEYRNPVDGGPAMRNLSMTLQTLRPGFEGRQRRHTGSRLYYVVEGSGTTTIDGVKHEWTQGDFLNVASWSWHGHVNTTDRDAVLFCVNDLPVLKALGYYREEIRP